MVHRRKFLQSAGAIGAPSLVPWRGARALSITEAPLAIGVIDAPDVKALALRALDAARSSGATYADVRLTRTVLQSFIIGHVRDEEQLAIGVRVIVDGKWGFAASPFWTPEEPATLAKIAVDQARANARAERVTTQKPVRPIELPPTPPAVGSWTTPVRIDPFTISPEEKQDYLAGLVRYADAYGNGIASDDAKMGFTRQERAVATSEGSFFTQTVYSSSGVFIIKVSPGSSIGDSGGQSIKTAARHLDLMGKGWELMLDADILSQIPVMCEEGLRLLKMPVKPVEVGRYDVVLDAQTATYLVDKTIGVSTELDRVVGLEANGTGTSFIGPNPMSALGSFHFGTSLLTVQMDRSTPKALSTVKWDDEGVIPEQVTLVDKGSLVNLQTTREQARWLAPYYGQQNIAVRSNGCAGAPTALDITMHRPPNLRMRPGNEALTFNDLVAQTRKGYALVGFDIDVDFQARNGASRAESGIMYEIVNGKLGAIVQGGGILFSTLELWKKVIGIGGASSAELWSQSRTKGQPEQTTEHSVSAVPILVRELAITRTSK